MVILLALLMATTAAPSSPEAPSPLPGSSSDETEPSGRNPTSSQVTRQAPAELVIQASESDAQLSVSATAAGWSRTCGASVTIDRPCLITPVPEGQLVDLRISGTRTFDSKVYLGERSTSVVITHRGYAVTVAGLVAMGIALAALRAGVSAAESGDLSEGNMLIRIGATVEAVGLIAILADLSGTHNQLKVVQ